ncbi:MAG: type II secretion system F family protein [Candidatus Dormibacteraeota bacterium]|nr:type II secretion system F family protein [Candidatus Dormibacteraeota bacterium]
MILGAVSVAAATFAGLYGLASFARVATRPNVGLIRATTLSPIEWRHEQRAMDSWYRRWLQPAAAMWGARLHLRPVRLDATYLAQCGLDPNSIDGVEFQILKLAGALGGAMAGIVIGVILAGAPLLLPLFAWVGYIAPSQFLSARRRKRQRAVQREMPEMVGMIRAFVVAGLPLERTLHLISADSQAHGILRGEIRAALGRYGVGASIEEALQTIGERTGVDEISLFVTALTQSKRLGTGLEQTLRDQELLIRMNQRNRSTAEAARVGTRLLGVLAGVYLPEFVILIMVPLFWGIIQRAFG